MLLLLRLFKSFAARPRLPVVTDTVKFAYQDLLRFGLVSVAVIAHMADRSWLWQMKETSPWTSYSRWECHAVKLLERCRVPGLLTSKPLLRHLN